MEQYGPFHRRGAPGGPGCSVTTLPVEGRAEDGSLAPGTLLDAGVQSSELELLRTVARGLGVKWGHDEFGWWAAVPAVPKSAFATAAETSPTPTHSTPHALYREDDNGARFLIATFSSRTAAEQRADELAKGGHKQLYFVEPLSPPCSVIQ